MNNNQIPDFDEINSNNQALAHSVKNMVGSLKNLNGEETAILLNYIMVNMNMDQIPSNYRRTLKNNI
jgi:hypothetical protein